MPMPDERRLIEELIIIRDMCCEMHRLEEINKLIEKVKAPVYDANHNIITRTEK